MTHKILWDFEIQADNLISARRPDLRVSLNKFHDFFRMGTFIYSTHMKLYPPSK